MFIAETYPTVQLNINFHVNGGLADLEARGDAAQFSLFSCSFREISVE